ncbi:MAG: Grx4 family monothiol glutaredoxin [Lysobacterales bacterium]
MSLDSPTRARIDALLTANPVVLFMKGDRFAPRCGFSATAIGTLESLGVDYATVDVLADEPIRQGIKDYGNWPTIPQLYVRGELLGGSDIVAQMFAQGELHRLLGVAAPNRTPPDITITDAAAAAIRPALDDAEDGVLHLVIDRDFKPQFQLAPAQSSDLVAHSNGIAVHFDLASAQRARGLVMDWVEDVAGGGLALRNPNAPRAVQALSPQDAAAQVGANALTVVDVRPTDERARASLNVPFVTFDDDGLERLQALPKDTPLAFLCHHGGRSQQAAENFRSLGFTDVANIVGGIDAWSRNLDPTIPTY